MEQLKFTIYLRTNAYPCVESHVDEYVILENIKYLHLIRYGDGEDCMYNLDDVINCFFCKEEKE